jgi:hypothetical protein
MADIDQKSSLYLTVELGIAIQIVKWIEQHTFEDVTTNDSF